jgi:hypothetical protein
MSTTEEVEINKVIQEIDDRKLLTTGELKTRKNNILQKMVFERDELKYYHKLLTNYRYVDEIDELRYGSYIRWFNISKPKSLKLLNGGFIVDIKNVNDNIIILCKNSLNKFFNLKMGESIIFQKNTKQEDLLIKILDHIKSSD